MPNFTKIVTSYLEAAMWSSCDDNEEPFDANYDFSDFGEGLVLSAEKDCRKFYELAQPYINDDITDDQIGYDFWLTRNGHGAGFWDRPEIYGEENADKLTEIAETFGETSLYVGDDGKLYLYP